MNNIKFIYWNVSFRSISSCQKLCGQLH